MIDIEILREQPEIIEKAIRDRNLTIDVAPILKTDQEYRELLQRVEKMRQERNTSAQGEGDREALKKAKTELKQQEEQLKIIQEKLFGLLRDLPNIQRSDVPLGKDDSQNEVVRVVGEPPKFKFEPKDYLQIAEQYNLLDLERAAKVSGARFTYLKNELALLSQALVRYAFDIALCEGFTPVLPPVLVGEEAMSGMGYLEHGGIDETYHFEKDNLFLVGTSEQAIGPMHMNEILEATKLPLRYVAFSSCFRREAGSYGKDTKGIFRVHQFDKVEMFSLTDENSSEQEHQFLLSLEEKFMQGLGLPYRVVKTCTGDLGWPSARTYDIEAWIPSEGRYRETHSTSTTTDYQSRRLKIRYRSESETRFVHMLNGTLVAVNRPLVALLELGQRADGSVEFPAVLHPYLYGKTKLTPKA